MIDRPHAFGEQKYSLLDNVIFSLRRRQVQKRLPNLADKRVADFGSGFDARLLLSLLRREKSAAGIAVDIAFTEGLRTVDRLELVVSDLDKAIAIPSASVDVVLSLAVLEHLHNPEQFLAEVFRVLKPGGMCVLTTPGPTAKPVLEFLAFRLGIIDAHEIRDHKNYFSSADLARMFAAAGFEAPLISARTFLCGMNNVVLATKAT